MTHIKKLVMHGFKSFVKKTELPFTSGINIILGSNGSGKSNIADALCFVLGRLSAKSMRAERTGNLIFLGTKEISPAKEAGVEVIFDNSKKIFSVPKEEISIKRIIRKNGQGIYKINNETKTRQEVLSLLAQGGIDPNGFNIILQGEIQNFVRMHSEERRKVIEEVSGISIYESRKEKSLKELEKTDEKLKEISAILRERTIYLSNLEKEREQALKFKKLEENIKKYKASIIYSDLIKKKKEAGNLQSEISKKNKEIDKFKKEKISFSSVIENLKGKIVSINSLIQTSTGLEQEKLNEQIANIRAELAGMNVKLENYENRLSELTNKKRELQEVINNNETEIRELQIEFPSATKKQKEIEIKKKKLEKLEEERKKFYAIKSELKSVKDRFHDKNITLQGYHSESELLLRQIKSLSLELFDDKTDSSRLRQLKISLSEKREMLENLIKTERELEKLSYANEIEIDRQNKLIEKISKMDICPLCKSKITQEHISSINQEIAPRIEFLKKQISDGDKKLKDMHEKKEILKGDAEQINTEISKRESDLVKISNINEKKEQIRALQEKIDALKREILELERKEKNLKESLDKNSLIEQKCETFRIEIQEISLITEENIDSEISFKQRELERSKISLKQLLRDEETLNEQIKELKNVLEEKEEILKEKKEQEEELSKKFHKLISERDSLQNKIRENETHLATKQNSVYNVEQEINNIKIEKARVDAEVENFETEMLQFPDIEIIKAKKESLVEKINKTQEILSRIGSVNLRALEVYDSIKKEYDSIKEKMDVITKEKEGILKIIQEIDIKKKKVFLKTLNSLNEIFSRNFSELSTKGKVFLEPENTKEPFEHGSGVEIIVKTGHGKYFDVKSLSGGEQTIVALSLIFAIQELNPYYFYILDEVDAALDKRNSERLSRLLQKHMRNGQYVVITHNDEIIANSTNLYGVTMHNGISKVVSLRV